jgi:uncharacterized protein (UPF0335 family)
MSYPQNSDAMTVEDAAGAQLKSFVERIERLEAEGKAISDDKADVYGEAKATGFQTRILKKLIAERRRDRDERLEEEAILELYRQALGME